MKIRSGKTWLVAWTLALNLSSTQAIAPEAQSYLERVLKIMETSFVRRERVDWAQLRAAVFRTARDAQTTTDTYPAILEALRIIGEKHSFLLTPQQLSNLGRQNGIGILTMPVAEGRAIIRVFPASPASKAELRVGDVVTLVNNRVPVANMPLLPASEETFELVYRRRDETQTRTVTVKRESYSSNFPPSARQLEGNVGYLDLPTHDGSGDVQGQDYATLAQNAIREVDAEPRCGWVVDLRRNGGGNMWPMIAGVGPILGEGVAGAFVYVSQKNLWSYAAGQSLLNGFKVHAVGGSFYQLRRPAPPVAVLTSSQTGSSGEAVTLSFVSRPNTRSFGEPTSGVPTVNASTRLSDGALLVLTVALMADRTGQTYDQPIKPDQPANINWTLLESDRDPVVSAALEWVRQQPACQKQ